MCGVSPPLSLYFVIATLGSILDSQLSWESCKFQLARWSLDRHYNHSDQNKLLLLRSSRSLFASNLPCKMTRKNDPRDLKFYMRPYPTKLTTTQHSFNPIISRGGVTNPPPMVDPSKSFWYKNSFEPTNNKSTKF